MCAFPTPSNTLADYAVIVYCEDGSINRGSFGRALSKLERALCDALDKRNTHVIPFAASLRQAGDVLREQDKKRGSAVAMMRDKLGLNG